MKGISAPISLGSQLHDARHICAFFNNDEEEYRILLPFIKEGLEVYLPDGRDAVIDTIRTPIVILGSAIQQNPFFVPPDEFPREFREWRAGRSSSAAAA